MEVCRQAPHADIDAAPLASAMPEVLCEDDADLLAP